MQVIKSTSNNQNLSVNTAAQDLFANVISIEELEPRLELAAKGPNYGVLFGDQSTWGYDSMIYGSAK